MIRFPRARLLCLTLLLGILAPQNARAAGDVQSAKNAVDSEAFRLRMAGLFHQKYLKRMPTSSEAAAFSSKWRAVPDGWKNALIALAATPAYFQNAGGTNEGFVTQLFQDMAGRAPDATEELPAAVEFLETGQRGQLAEVIADSNDFKMWAVQGCYAMFMRREATESEAEKGTLKLDAGGINAFIVELVTSTEYFQKRGGNSAAKWQSALKEDLMSAAPNGAGDEVYSGPVFPSNIPETGMGAPTGGAMGSARTPLVRALMSSPEYRAGQVQGWYQKFLKRAATPAELQQWSGALQSGSSEAVVTGILTSDEYFNRAGGTTDAFVKRLSQDLLGRAGGKVGSGKLGSGKHGLPSKSDVIDLIRNLPVLQNK
ncbi:MAG TPA: hypothetical protein VF600_16600 [Abditibacteriaceae bacterium]|jgi:hypothetical protein